MYENGADGEIKWRRYFLAKIARARRSENGPRLPLWLAIPWSGGVEGCELMPSQVGSWLGGNE